MFRLYTDKTTGRKRWRNEDILHLVRGLVNMPAYIWE